MDTTFHDSNHKATCSDLVGCSVSKLFIFSFGHMYNLIIYPPPRINSTYLGNRNRNIIRLFFLALPIFPNSLAHGIPKTYFCCQSTKPYPQRNPQRSMGQPNHAPKTPPQRPQSFPGDSGSVPVLGNN